MPEILKPEHFVAIAGGNKAEGERLYQEYCVEAIMATQDIKALFALGYVMKREDMPDGDIVLTFEN